MMRFVFALLVGLSLCKSALAVELIQSFQSHVRVETDGTLDVRETIAVSAEGEQIRRGIYRDFPTARGRFWWGKYRTTFDVQSVTRNGKPEPWNVVSIDNGRRLYIGDQDVLVPRGTHTYQIHYRSGRQVGFFPAHDELYWNVTGNFWRFPIADVTGTIELPAGASAQDARAYTGAVGSTSQDGATLQIAASQVAFKTTGGLGQGSGLTVVVAWPKGFVVAPTSLVRFRQALGDNLSMVVGVLGLLLVTVFYLVAWWAYGRDPERGTIIAQYDPPRGLSAPACRFILNMGWDKKTFTAALIDMAARGYVRMQRLSDGVFTLTRTSRDETAVRLPPAEQACAKKLFADWESLPLRAEQHKDINAGMTALERALDDEHDKIHFMLNHSLLTVGIGLSVMCFAAMAVLDGDVMPDMVLGVMGGWLVFAIYFLIRRFWTLVRHASLILKTAVIVILTAAIEILPNISLVSAIFSETGAFLARGSIGLAAQVTLTLVVINLIFFEIMKAPTAAGRKLMDHIEGLRHYLTVAEKDRLNFHNPPALTPARFDAMLPYAIALDVENEWGAQFDAAMHRAAVESGGTWSRDDYEPGWFPNYRTDFRGHSWSGFSNGFATAISTASVGPPSQVSGLSGGRGFSGGGGGGGGGGGW